MYICFLREAYEKARRFQFENINIQCKISNKKNISYSKQNLQIVIYQYQVLHMSFRVSSIRSEFNLGVLFKIKIDLFSIQK